MACFCQMRLLGFKDMRCYLNFMQLAIDRTSLQIQNSGLHGSFSSHPTMLLKKLKSPLFIRKYSQIKWKDVVLKTRTTVTYFSLVFNNNASWWYVELGIYLFLVPNKTHSQEAKDQWRHFSNIDIYMKIFLYLSFY